MNDIKNELQEKIKLYSDKKYFEGYIKNEFLTDDGDADIKITLNNKNELFDKRTRENQLDLNKELYDYIDEKTAMLDNNIQINLHIKSTNISEEDQSIAKHIFKEHYAIELYKVQKQYRIVKNKTIKLVIFGLSMILLYGLIYYWKGSEFFLEVFGFIFSFSLWKAFENIIYTMNDLKYKSEAMAQRLLMEIEFEKE